jgi:hypothetical protein
MQLCDFISILFTPQSPFDLSFRLFHFQHVEALCLFAVPHNNCTTVIVESRTSEDAPLLLRRGECEGGNVILRKKSGDKSVDWYCTVLIIK